MDNKRNLVGVEEFLALSTKWPCLDVRTPLEHEKGHIPGTLNMPLFSNEQRANVGTLYKQKGSRAAIIKGLDHVGPNMSGILKEGIKIAGKENSLLLHCWRGGMRSESMAWLFALAGIRCTILEGGYKNYRNHVLKSLGSIENIIVVGGLTGSGKTEILKEIAKRGEQVIDLEGIANHRGSAFGAIGMPPQPTSEQFSNILYDEYSSMAKDKRIFVEDESLNIGSVFMPEEFYKKIRDSKVIAVICDVESRMGRLMEEYGKMPEDKLKASIERIRKRLGGKDADAAIEAIDNKNMHVAIKLILAYYDKSYKFGLGKRDKSKVSLIDTSCESSSKNAERIIKIAKSPGF